MSKPTVSVVIPAWKAEVYLERAVQSVLSQTCAPLEILIVDDGSPDNTFAVANSFPKPVRALRKLNGGPASARNLGAKEATGDWIAFLDADDLWTPQKLERQLSLADPQIAIIHCLCGDARRPSDWLTFDDIWKRNTITTSSVLIQRRVFRELGGFDEDPALVGVEDHNLWLKVAAAGWKIRTLQEVLVSYTPTPASLTRQIERFARAELANLQKLSLELGMDTQPVRDRRVNILDEYGRELLYFRHLEPARRYLRMALEERFSPSRLAWWVASHADSRLWTALDRVRGRSIVA